jgi:AAA15 family ATPase/GTPase
MLDHLIVQNYRLFKDLNIPKLGQVNLVTGKNNAGKSTLLEVIRIWASEGDSSVVNNILYKRGDWEEGNPRKTYERLVSDLQFLFGKHQEVLIKLNEIEISLGPLTRERDRLFNAQVLHVTNEKRRKKNEISFANGYQNYPQDKAIFIPPSIDFDNTMIMLWDRIELTPREENVKDVLRIIVPDLADLGISKKGAKVRLKNAEIPISLKNFGEGTNRLLMIALALVSAKDNILLIDEIDLGLHYSVHEQLWELIFQFAKEWNIQVFATTHSQDCLSAFSYVANRDEYKEMGLSLRLQREKDNIIAVDYAPEELEVALSANIETR